MEGSISYHTCWDKVLWFYSRDHNDKQNVIATFITRSLRDFALTKEWKYFFVLCSSLFIYKIYTMLQSLQSPLLGRPTLVSCLFHFNHETIFWVNQVADIDAFCIAGWNYMKCWKKPVELIMGKWVLQV